MRPFPHAAAAFVITVMLAFPAAATVVVNRTEAARFTTPNYAAPAPVPALVPAIVPATGTTIILVGNGTLSNTAPQQPAPSAPGTGVPEPFVWGLLIAGFGIIGLAGRWRRDWRSVSA